MKQMTAPTRKTAKNPKSLGSEQIRPRELRYPVSSYSILREEVQGEIEFPISELLLSGRKEPKGLALFSFFAGAGFLDLGFEAAGFYPAFVNEFNLEFLRAHKHSRSIMNFPLPSYGDSSASVEAFTQGLGERRLASMVNAAREDALVGFVGGPPCPDFSVGGKNRGRHGENGKLTATYFELIAKQKPDWFLFENVKGLWSTKRHKAFYEENIKAILAKGYAVTDQLINSIEYGAPQDRARVIAIGFAAPLALKLGFTPGQYIPREEIPWDKYKRYDSKSVFKMDWPKTQEFGTDDEALPHHLPKELTVAHWFAKNSVEQHPNANHQFQPRAGLARFETVDEGDDSRKSYKRLHRNRYSPTACYGNNEVHLHPTKPRRISVAEALALQTLPSNFELPQNMTLSAMFKTIGNGVPFVAALGLANMIRDIIEEKL